MSGLADATLPTDALNQQSGDTRYYLKTMPLNQITIPTASLNMNS